MSRKFKNLMAERFRNKYRSQSSRLNGYDYSTNGAYFITICTRKKFPCFGVIYDGKMILSEIGIIVNDLWSEILNHFPNALLDEFVIMPDHIHGIIIIKSKFISKSVIKSGNPYWKSNSIGSIINQFKRACTIKAKSIGLDIPWQPRFYDHIIRSDNEFNRIRMYIKDNPDNWSNN